MSLVVDASVAIKWFVRENLHEQALELLDRDDDLHAPDLIFAEVANIAWKKCIRGEILRDQAETIVAATQGYVRHVHPSGALVARALDMALALNHPVYDCLYLACADVLNGVIVTADERFATACKKTEHAARIWYLGGFAP